jgi:spoIIIJ-associated protein
MSEQLYEAKGATVEEAIAAGLAHLGIDRENAVITVVDEGSKGFLGLGGREAVVRLTAVAPSAAAPEAVDEAPVKAAPPVEDAVPAEAPPEAEAEAALALEVVRSLLSKMQIKAEATIRYSPPDDLTGERLPLVDIRGRDLAVLIGPRGEILDALQYLARLIVGNQLHQRARFLIDVESYRERREQALSRLAERMADKAVKSGRPMTLEAMPAYERRIIHMALRQHPNVRTQSDGEGSRRRVRIFPN